MNMNFHHIGYACKSIEQSVAFFEQLNYLKESPVYEDELQKAKILFMVNNAIRVELLEPTTDDSPVASFVKKNIKMYHQAFTVDSIKDSIKFLKEKKYILISPPKPATAFNGKQVCFLMSRTRDIIELIEK